MYPSIFTRFPVIKAVKSKVRNFSTFWPPWVRPWDYRGKFTWIEREFNACQTPRSMYPSIFNRLRYSKLLVENCDIFTSHLCLAAPQGLPRRNVAKIYTKLE